MRRLTERFLAQPVVLGRLVALIAVTSLVGGACSSSEPVVASVGEDEVVLAYVDRGVDTEAAECFVGLGQREFGLDALLPDAASPTDRPLVDEILANCENAVAMLEAEEPPPRPTIERGPFDFGDDDALDRLWIACDWGDGSACDQLWEEAPIGSVYESFGVTCGDRPEILDCEDLSSRAAEPVGQTGDDD